jgi:hypothetical protein
LKKVPIDTESPEFRARAEHRRRTWEGVTIHTNFDDIKRAEYAFWSTQPTHLVMTTVSEMSAAAHGLKGIHVRRLHRPHRAAK